jgi:hypothetical protein
MYETVEVELGPGTAEDQNVGLLESGTGRYEVSAVQVETLRIPWLKAMKTTT